MGEPLSQVDETTATQGETSETIATQMKEMQKPSLHFEEAIPSFPENEQVEALEYQRIWNEVNKVAVGAASRRVYEFCKSDRDRLANTKLFHLFSNGGLSREEWLEKDLDTPSEEWKKFIYDTIVPLIEKKAA